MGVHGALPLHLASELRVAPPGAIPVHERPASSLTNTLRLKVAIAISLRRAGFCAM